CSDANAMFDQITCFTNSTPRMDLVAPGAPILSDSLRGRTEMYWGTSQAAPAAVGVAALLLECDPTLTPAQVKQILTSTGVPRMDTRNGVTAPSVRALEAVKAVCDDKVPGSMPDAGADAGQPDAGVVDAGSPGGKDASAAVEAGAGGPAPVNDASGPWSGSVPDAGPTQTGTDGVVVGKPDGGAGAGVTADAEADCDCATAGASRSGTGAGAWLAAFALALTLGRRRARRNQAGTTHAR
ncbi:MAG TPA: S8 family serine peptidase, partial [Polyangiales bacterium]